MKPDCRQLHERLSALAREWRASGLPSFSALMAMADRLDRWKGAHRVTGVWGKGPVMVTATLDDALGQGLQIIDRYATVMGATVLRAGLYLKPEQIITTCRQYRPDYLGMTVLQFDTEDDIRTIRENISPDIRIIAGGPVFTADPGLAGQVGIYFVASDLSAFIDFMLSQPESTSFRD